MKDKGMRACKFGQGQRNKAQEHDTRRYKRRYHFWDHVRQADGLATRGDLIG